MFEHECPYCGHGSNDTDDMHVEDESYEVECGGCEKTYFVTISYSVDYESHTKEDEEKRTARAEQYAKRLREFMV